MTKNRNLNRINIVISIIVSFIAWLYVVYNYSPMKTVSYSSVPITYVGMDVLSERGLSIKSTTYDYVDISLNEERTEYTNTTADDITVVADVSQAVIGHNGISLEIIPPEGSTVKKTSNKMVSVEIAEGTTKDVSVTPIFDRKSGDGNEPIASTMSYRKVSIVGFADNVNRVKYATVKINKDSLSGDGYKSFVLEPVAVDENGRTVPHVQVLPSEIALSATIGKTQEVGLTVSVYGAEKGVSFIAPKTIKIKGTATVLKNLKKIEAEPVDLTGITEDTTVEINYILPEGVYIAQDSMTQVISVTKEK